MRSSALRVGPRREGRIRRRATPWRAGRRRIGRGRIGRGRIHPDLQIARCSAAGPSTWAAGPPEGCQSVARANDHREGRVSGASSWRPRRSAPSSLRSTAYPSSGQGTASDGTVLLCRSGSRSPAAVASLHRQAPTLLRRCGAGLAHTFHNWRRCRRPSTAFGRCWRPPSFRTGARSMLASIRRCSQRPPSASPQGPTTARIGQPAVLRTDGVLQRSAARKRLTTAKARARSTRARAWPSNGSRGGRQSDQHAGGDCEAPSLTQRLSMRTTVPASDTT